MLDIAMFYKYENGFLTGSAYVFWIARVVHNLHEKMFDLASSVEAHCRSDLKESMITCYFFNAFKSKELVWFYPALLIGELLIFAPQGTFCF
ncbi:hypothetical protein L6164_037412 [Bauhinia variegata]|uniref:Uncharacterized protein n=1 Tax=Bauhinia variegata TaxID=167791 RepID=A0ACB9KK42_BAUVA|nr:hypothetical protein L6164_037412 [Bauhinia variegata]